MIRIIKTFPAPEILTTEGITETAQLENDFSNDRAAYTTATGISNRDLVKMSFDNSIYGDTTVKDHLILDQHEKCCFCEAKFLDNSYGDVEHFRPKAAYKKLGANGLTYPGYYWLAYEWTNLMFSCEKCNRSFKKNEFPLNTEITRKPYHDHPNDINNEDQLLINPNIEDPSLYITFKEEVPVPVNACAKGRKSIDIFKLERMNNTRLEYLLLLKNTLIFHKVNRNDDVQIQLAMDTFNISEQEVMHRIDIADLFFNNAAKDSAKFAHCVRCKFSELPTTN